MVTKPCSILAREISGDKRGVAHSATVMLGAALIGSNYRLRVTALAMILIEDAEVCVHPMIIGESALGPLRDRSTVVSLLDGQTLDA